MAGPTPVSALLHTTTMVTAELDIISDKYAIIGLGILILAGFTVLYQLNIKKVIAFYIASQLGYICYSSLLSIQSYNHLFYHGLFIKFIKYKVI